MFTTNLMLLMPVIGVAAGLVAAMLVVRSRDLRLASVGFNAKNSRLLVPHYTTEGAMVAVSIPLAILLLGCSYFMLQEYLKPVPAASTDVGRITIIHIDSLGPPPTITDDNGVVDYTTALNKRPFSSGIPRPVADNTVPDSADIGPTNGWASNGTIDPRALKGDSVQIVRDDIPAKGYRALEKVPELVKRVDPVYPAIAIRTESEGHVFVIALLDIDGRVIKVELSRSSGNPSLDGAALEAVKQWVFTPAIAPDGRPTRVWQMCPINFTMSN